MSINRAETPTETSSPHGSENDHGDKLDADIQKSAARVIKHMNEDHEDSLIAYVLAFATGVEDNEDENASLLLQQVRNGQRTISGAKLKGVDRDGFLLDVEVEEGCHILNVRVPYDRPIEKARDLHAIAVAMHRKAYDKLGVWYKTKNRYYKQAAKMIAFHTYKTVKKEKKNIARVTLVGATAAAGYFYFVGSKTRNGRVQ